MEHPPAADLHIHTYYSDSTLSPAEIILIAQEQRLQCIALTDHDCVAGIPEAMNATGLNGREIVPGIELSADHQGKDIHILGYFIDHNSAPLLERLSCFQETRSDRLKEMIERLKEQGVNDLDFDEITSAARADALGRPHLAKALIEKGWARDTREAFRKYLGEDCPAYVPKHKLSPFAAIKLIHAAGGAAVMAHPMLTGRDELIPEMVEAGLDGLEVFYPNCSQPVRDYYGGIAKKHGLVTTGGSDAHGAIKRHTYIGKVRIPCSMVAQLRERAQKDDQ